MFLQEAHSSKATEKYGVINLIVTYFFHMGKQIFALFKLVAMANNMKELVKNVKILNALSAEHSPLFCSFLNLTNISRGRGHWKFNNSLI